MRKQTQEDLNKIYHQEDMLKGNINRMCVTDNITELYRMAHFAYRRITAILEINEDRLTEEEDED